MIVAAQCRAARGLLNWSQQKLADAARVDFVKVDEFETGAAPIDNVTVEDLQRALEAAGVEFILGPRPGVLLKDSVSFSSVDNTERRALADSLPTPVQLKDGRTLATLTDVIKLLADLPEDRRAAEKWEQISEMMADATIGRQMYRNRLLGHLRQALRAEGLL
jgi:transcriptional regulator with XRE-family HTH domain